ncbi:MAG: hypothetical protein H2042_01840 [Rhizobiales bacterium]|nr:hypothetical protein [Hyphomicrobiales bacterium]
MTDKTNVTPLASAKSPEKAASGKSVAAAANAAQKAAPAAQAAPEAKSAPAPAVKSGSTDAAVETKTVPVGVAFADLPWQMIEAGHVVLVADHSEGEFQGWWPAKVISRTDDKATCEWLGYEQMGRFTKSIMALSLMHPAHKD